MTQPILLVPIDYTGCGHEVAHIAADYASRLEASVILLSVVDLPEGLPEHTLVHPVEAPQTWVDISTWLDEDAVEHLEPMATHFTARGCATRIAIRHGDPTEAILAAAEDLGATLIVMGTHGRKGLRRLIEGSVAEGVIRRATVPVMTIRSREPGAHPGKSAAQIQAERELAG